MSRPIRLKRLYSAALSLGTLLAGSSIAPPPSAAQETRLAQLFYPPAAGPQIVAVTGQGRARVAADLAQIEIAVTNRKPRDPFAPEAQALPRPEPEPEAITAATLAPIVEALTAAGIPSNKIKVNVNPIAKVRPLYGRVNSSIAIEVDKPTAERVDQLVKTANMAVQQLSDRSKVYLEEVYVQYSVNSCEALENAAYLAAMQDAKLRANAVAKAMGVELAATPSVAELPFLGRFYSPCSQEEGITETLFRRPLTPYNPATLPVVEVFRELAVTYRPR